MASPLTPRQTGRKQRITLSGAGSSYDAYIPFPLPPDPPIAMDGLQKLNEKAAQLMGRLDGMSIILPDIKLFLYQYVRKEAVLSSQIEGTQSSLSDLLIYELAEAPGSPIDDVEEVSSYVAALNYGLRRMRDGFPLSLRLLREIHEVLLSTGRGQHKSPGEFRVTQNWIGGSRPGTALFVPPSPEVLMDCLGPLEQFLHDTENPLPTLIKVGLVHVQFETIHPFLDGNGRLGRLLITLMLCREGHLQEPVLYLSLYLKRHQQTYYDLLQEVRIKGHWERWLTFFLEGIIDTCQSAISAALQLRTLLEADRRKVERLKRATPNALRVLDTLIQQPIVSIPYLQQRLTLSAPTVTKSLEHLIELGIVKEMTGRERNRHYVYDAYLALLSEGTEPLPQ